MSFADTITAEGFAGKLMADWMGWIGDGRVHRVSRYNSTFLPVINNQLSLMKIAGFKGVRATWLGPNYTFIHQACLTMAEACGDLGMLFSLLIDPHVNGQASWWLDPGFLAMCSSGAYIPEKWLSDFSTGINYGNVVLPAGFSVLYNQQGFGWPNAYSAPNAGYASCNAETLAEIKTVNKLATMKWPCVCLGFCDAGLPTPPGVTPANFTGTRDYSHWVWDNSKAPRQIDHEAGNMFLDTVGALQFCPTAPYVGMVWNDADEINGASIEAFMSAYAGVRIGA